MASPGLARPGRGGPIDWDVWDGGVGMGGGGGAGSGRGRQGVTLLQYMRDAGVAPDAVAYTALIGLLAKVHWHGATRPAR